MPFKLHKIFEWAETDDGVYTKTRKKYKYKCD